MPSKEEVSLVAISGIKFPTSSREYLINLVRDVVVANNAKFIIVAGHTIDGQALEKELVAQIKYEKSRLGIEKKKAKEKSKKENRKFDPKPHEFNQHKFEEDFIRAFAFGLDDFLPKIEGVNYHIVIAEKVFDRPIGARILECLKGLRDDIRLIGDRKDGTYDTEVKVPVRTRGFEEIRVIVPRSRPWFYRIITGLMQRLINSFVARTFSSKPALILVGCTGTAAHLPFFEGVPSTSVPVLRKIDEQISTENMVGCVLIKAISDDNGSKVIPVPRTYDFRTVVSKEWDLTIPEDASRAEKLVLNNLKSSPASFSTLVFRINTAKAKKMRLGNSHNDVNGVDENQIKNTLEKLKARGIVVYSEKSNHYEIDERHLNKIQITLEDLLKNTKTIKIAEMSCTHIGALKTLYHTLLNLFPKQAYDADAIIDNGDIIQGIAHQYEYNGELLPIAIGFDKQEVLAGAIKARNILDIFKRRLKEFEGKRIPKDELIGKCLKKYIYNIGNHPKWKHHYKDALILKIFESELKERLVKGIMNICEKANISIEYTLVNKIVEEKVVRVGESRMVEIDGVLIGVKHPHKARTQSKSHRIQDVVDFTWRTFDQFSSRVAKKSKGFALVHVANFHEAAAVHVVKFGKTVFGVMTGAYLKDTEFENNNDKVVDYGIAMVTVCLNEEGLLIYSEVEFNNTIHPDDEKIISADKVYTSDVLRLCSELDKIARLPWR